MFRRFLLAQRILQNADPGAGGGGGGDSGFTDAQLTTIKSLVSGVVNSSIAARDKMSDKKRAEDAQKLREDFTTILTEKLSALSPSKDPDDGGAGGKGGKGGKNDVELQTLRQQIQELKTQSEADRKIAKDASARMKAGTLRDATSAALAAAGITGSHFKGAFAMLQQEGRIRFQDEDSDEMVFVDDSGAEVDLKVGLSGWLKGEDAKIFLPPTGAGGAGTRRAAGGPPPPPGKPTREQGMAALGAALEGALRGE